MRFSHDREADSQLLSVENHFSSGLPTPILHIGSMNHMQQQQQQQQQQQLSPSSIPLHSRCDLPASPSSAQLE